MDKKSLEEILKARTRIALPALGSTLALTTFAIADLYVQGLTKNSIWNYFSPGISPQEAASKDLLIAGFGLAGILATYFYLKGRVFPIADALGYTSFQKDMKEEAGVLIEWLSAEGIDVTFDNDAINLLSRVMYSQREPLVFAYTYCTWAAVDAAKKGEKTVSKWDMWETYGRMEWIFRAEPDEAKSILEIFAGICRKIRGIREVREPDAIEEMKKKLMDPKYILETGLNAEHPVQPYEKTIVG